MKCPFCFDPDTKVTDSRTMDEGTAIRRRRFCDKCGKRFTTYERIDTILLAVVKRNGTCEPFDRAKLLNGIMKSCAKRPVSMQQIENIVLDVETAVLNSMGKEISAEAIGKLVMDRLKDVDEVAYVRFASVYRQFKDIDTFMEELTNMLREKNKCQNPL